MPAAKGSARTPLRPISVVLLGDESRIITFKNNGVLIFLLVRGHEQFQNPRTAHFRRKVRTGEEREEKNMLLVVATTF